MKAYILIVAILLITACTKQATNLQQHSSNISNAITTYYLDSTYYFNTDDWDQLPFDSCTNEFVSLHGKVNYGYLITVDDSVKIFDSSWLHSDSTYGIGLTSGKKYCYYENAHSRQVDIWRDSDYFQLRNHFISKIKFHQVGSTNDFIIIEYIHIVSDRAGNILIDSVYNDYGSCL